MNHHNHQMIHVPGYIGPGIWFNMHLDAAEATTLTQQRIVIDRIRLLQSKFPCQSCKIHFGDYLKQYPPENIIGTSPEALFRWTVAFHNKVNLLNNKTPVTYTEARSIFFDQSFFCTTDCSEITPSSSKLGYVILPTSKRR